METPEKSVGGRAPERIHIYQTISIGPDDVPCISVWRGSASRFNASTPRPFSYQVYVVDPPVSTSIPASSVAERDRGFAGEFLTALSGDDGGEMETWRLDIWFAAGRSWGARESVAHYRAAEAHRRGKKLHTVPSYFGPDSWGCRCRGLLLAIDRTKGWSDEGGVQVVEFDRGVGTTVVREGGDGLMMRVRYDVDDGEIERATEGEMDEHGYDGYDMERNWGTTVKEWRASVSGERSLGSWLRSVWLMALNRQQYETMTGREE